TADRNERSRARLAALLDVVQVLGFGLELLDRSRASTERFSVEPSSVLPHLAQLAHHSSLSDLGAVVSSPGWTRTNNPPVNSRMLCQLSYRGIGGGIVARRQANALISSRTSASFSWSPWRASGDASTS